MSMSILGGKTDVFQGKLIEEWVGLGRALLFE